ncbi:MAG: DUF3783 domain-containing protein [Clostridium sp.]|nr:DUF3783 domain-containing protein [Clostridium sp.]MCM1172555.1 DUF3783 domain-containing protein [Clostridium sp.]MCM1209430.1 DUF3783 domain-containing protein [Ruminococcus sp.]
MKKILLYSYPNDIHKKISDICLACEIECKKIPKKRFLQTIGNHIGIPGHEGTGELYGESDLAEPVMLLAGMSTSELDSILDTFKNLGIPSVGFKAVVTSHNINWTILDLYEELAREREAMQKRQG